jgi:alpha-tubulin suppressor-like RCC1 family protein
MAAGLAHTCIIRNDNSLVCWGLNNYGQLGIGSGVWYVGAESGDMGDNLEVTDLGKGKCDHSKVFNTALLE